MKIRLLALAVGGVCATALAQTPMDPAPVLRIIREDIKQGKGSAHRNSENAFMLEAAVSKYPANVIGMTSLTGTDQAWFLEPHASFADVEKTMEAFDKPDAKYGQLDELDAEYRTSSRAWLAVYRPDISYHAQDLVQNLPKARFFNVTMMRIQNGRDADFTEIGKMYVDAAQKAIDDQPVAVYEIVSGLPAGTFLLFAPTTSLKALDGDAERSRAVLQAMGDTVAKRFTKTVAETIVSSESLLFSIDPRMSYVSKEIADADPGFWNPKPEEAKAPEKTRPKATKAAAK